MVEIKDIDALKMWVEKVIRTEKFRFKIYDNIDYGTTIEDLIGSNYPQSFIECELKREITDSLLSHPLISEITSWFFTREGSRMHISFVIVSQLGESEVTYIV